jgi:hypothetical protein
LSTFDDVLGDPTGVVMLYDPVGNRADSVEYGSESPSWFAEGADAPSPPSGRSIARSPDGHDTDHNDVDFAVRDSTPGSRNP